MRNLPPLPDDSQHLAIIGQNGTGKSVAGVAHLAWRSYDRMPWFIIDYKKDKYLKQIGATRFDVNDRIPKAPGLYHINPPPEGGSLDDFLMRAWHREKVGIYVDEGYMVGQRSKPFEYVLTQGRSKRIPLIVCSQRPVWLNKFVFAEAKFFQVFHLNDREDRREVARYVPVDVNYDETLLEYHSLYFASGRNGRPLNERLITLDPVPYGDEVLDVFDRRKPRHVKRI